jgi:hypothetical protein
MICDLVGEEDAGLVASGERRFAARTNPQR